MKSTDELEKTLLNKSNIYDYLNDNKKEMQIPKLNEYLNKLLAEKKMNVSDIKNKTSMGNYIYEIFNGKKTNPSRDYILAICLAMELSYKESKDLLKYAKVAPLYARDKRDSIVMSCIHNSKGFMECNETLNLNDEKLLSTDK